MMSKKRVCLSCICELTLNEWYELILKRLSLKDLIAMKRTCSAFAGFVRLLELIKEKEGVFGSFGKQCWNRLNRYDVTTWFNDDLIRLVRYQPKYILAYDESERTRAFGVYANEEDLHKAFERAMQLNIVRVSRVTNTVWSQQRQHCGGSLLYIADRSDNRCWYIWVCGLENKWSQ